MANMTGSTSSIIKGHGHCSYDLLPNCMQWALCIPNTMHGVIMASTFLEVTTPKDINITGFRAEHAWLRHRHKCRHTRYRLSVTNITFRLTPGLDPGCNPSQDGPLTN